MANLRVNTLANASSLAATTSYLFSATDRKVRAVQAVYTSTTSSFTLALQYSQDNVTWKDFTTATAISNASGDVDWQVLDTKDGLYWRVLATRTSGTLTTLKVYLAHVER